MGTLVLQPEVDSAGAVVRDANGEASYPRVREFTRANPDYPQLDGKREWLSWNWGDSRVYVLASDVVFMKVARPIPSCS